MKKRVGLLVISLLLILTLSITSCTGNQDATNQNDNEADVQDNSNDKEQDDSQGEIDINETALSFVNDLLNEKYDDAYENYSFTNQMLQEINPTYLEQAMQQLKHSVGDFVKIAETQEIEQSSYNVIAVVCKFEKDYMSLNVIFDQEKKIAGFRFANPQGFEKTSEDTQENIPNNIVEQEVAVDNGEWILPGTLTLPKGEGPFSAVILVHGSGANDRDETVGPNKPFRDIAWGLASKGIAVLRYEKRTKEYEVKLMQNVESLTVKERTIDDALSAVELLKNHSSIDEDKIYVLGHSLGGYLIPRIGVQDGDIAGFIVMAGSARPLEDLVVEQIEYLTALDGNVTKEEQQQIDSMKISRDRIKNLDFDVNTSPTELMGFGATFWLDLKDYEPTEMVKELDRPILVLQGERDYQVTMVDFENWKNAIGDQNYATFKSFEKLNHLFMPGEGAPNPNEYFLENNVSQEVIDCIIQWINE